MFFSSDHAIGTARRKDRTSAQACVISTPARPKKCGSVRMSGMKKMPLRAEEQIDALIKAERGIDTAANIQTRPEIKPEIIDVLPDEAMPQKADKHPAGKPAQPASPVQQPAQPAQPVQPVSPTDQPDNQGGEQP